MNLSKYCILALDDGPDILTAVWVGNPNERIALPGYGADLAAPIWQDYMEVAAAKPCDDFPVPDTLPDLTTHYSQYTADPNSDSSTGGTKPKPGDTTTTTTTTDGTGTGGDNGYDPNLYAPGAGQDPAPTPPTPGGGGDQGGGGANGGGVTP